MTLMQEHAVLGQVALAYTPMINRKREVVATRLTVFPERPDTAPDATALLAALQEVWPPAEAAANEPLKLSPRPLDPASQSPRAPVARPPVTLNLAGEGLLRAVMTAEKTCEVPMPAWPATPPSRRSCVSCTRLAPC